METELMKLIRQLNPRNYFNGYALAAPTLHISVAGTPIPPAFFCTKQYCTTWYRDQFGKVKILLTDHFLAELAKLF
jgi:hypothetical protein